MVPSLTFIYSKTTQLITHDIPVRCIDLIILVNSWIQAFTPVFVTHADHEMHNKINALN